MAHHIKIVVFLFSLSVFYSCQDADRPIGPENFLLIKDDYTPAFEIQTWKDGKKAAYTLTFDDDRVSHYQLAWPEMKKRGVVGTFNLNTGSIRNWEPWKQLLRYGNEIASHTVNHKDLTTLSPFEIEQELQNSKSHIFTNTEVMPVSFTNPFGKSNIQVEELIAKYYLSARNNWGINPAEMTKKERFELKVDGIYPPFSRESIEEQIISAISQGGYLMVGFHSLWVDENLPNETFAPLQLFQSHLDDIKNYSSELWIATQGDVIRYILLRQNSQIEIKKDKNSIICFLKTDLDPVLFDKSLTIKINWPDNWIGSNIFAFSDKSYYETAIYAKVDSSSYVSVFAGKQTYFQAYE